MIKSKLYTEAFPWELSENSEDNLTCKIDDYKLDVQKNINHWWWLVSYKGDLIPTFSNNTSSKYRAIGLAEGTYLGHSTSKASK